MDHYHRQADYLGVNKMGKNIKKSPIHQPTFPSSTKQQQPQAQPQPQPQPHVYNINKNDFRELVQQLTGSPMRDSPSRPPQSQPRPPNNRLQRVRPPPLAPTNRPPVPVHHYPAMAPPPAHIHPQPMAPHPYSNNNFVRPPPAHQFDQLSPGMRLPPTPTDVWTNTADSPISVYMRYLQNSIINSSPRQFQTSMQGQAPQNVTQYQPPLLPGPAMPQLPSPRANAPPPRSSAALPAPQMNGTPSSAPSVGPNAPPSPFLLSPTSQFLLPSPTGLWNVLSPRSQYPLLSPGYQFAPPLSPSFSFSSLGQAGILGAGPNTPSSPGPGYGFSALSPSGLFPISSPRWRNQ